MHKIWIESMQYHVIPEEDWQPFYNWYCQKYPRGDVMISAAYPEWKSEEPGLELSNWLALWFEAHLTFDMFKRAENEDFARQLILDMTTAGFKVAKE